MVFKRGIERLLQIRLLRDNCNNSKTVKMVTNFSAHILWSQMALIALLAPCKHRVHLETSHDYQHLSQFPQRAKEPRYSQESLPT